MSDTFLIYEEKLIDVLPRIADHYGVDINTILKDNDMPDMLCVQGERIFYPEPADSGALQQFRDRLQPAGAD